MVDALHEARRVLRAGGILIDARPDSRIRPRVEHDGRRVGALLTRRLEERDDGAADAAVERVKREGLFRRVRAGRFWHALEFPSRGALDAYLSDQLRFRRRIAWTVSAGARRAWRDDPFRVVRAVRFEVLEARPRKRAASGRARRGASRRTG